MMFLARSFWRCFFTGRGSGRGDVVGDSTINRGGVDGEDGDGLGDLDDSGDEEVIAEGCIVVGVGGAVV